MCIFSMKVDSVSNTNIFARLQGARQYLAYQMSLSAAQDLAMILPLPVASGTGENDLEFVSLDGYPEFFSDLANGFQGLLGMTVGSTPPLLPLKVQQVGAFEASFVPTLGDFQRLDSRFRVPESSWRELPQYRDYGFAVFKLRAGDKVRPHPMAFSFPTRDPRRLFYPTVHIHDGVVRAEADFHHVFYAQAPDFPEWCEAGITFWIPAPHPTAWSVDTRRTSGLIHERQRLYLSWIVGRHENQDVWILERGGRGSGM